MPRTCGFRAGSSTSYIAGGPPARVCGEETQVFLVVFRLAMRGTGPETSRYRLDMYDLPPRFTGVVGRPNINLPKVATMAEKSLKDLFVMTLKDIYHAEKQILKALPKMAKSSEGSELKEALEKHRKETEGQVERLEEVFKLMDMKPSAKTCEAIKGLLAEGEEVIEECEDSGVRDAGMIAAAQAVEHYEIARYGTLRAWAEELGMDDAATLLEETLQEEKKADEILNEIALQGGVNRQAA
jgi:ferritin-like metal-binding protein YciE